MRFSEFFALVKQAAQYETLMNAVNCDVPHRFIRETMTGKKEEVPEKKETLRRRQIIPFFLQTSDEMEFITLPYRNQ